MTRRVAATIATLFTLVVCLMAHSALGANDDALVAIFSMVVGQLITVATWVKND